MRCSADLKLRRCMRSGADDIGSKGDPAGRDCENTGTFRQELLTEEQLQHPKFPLNTSKHFPKRNIRAADDHDYPAVRGKTR